MIFINKVILIGRLTKDPELSYAANTGNAICRLTLAVTRPFKKEETDFINCIAFGKTGETIAQYLTKGRQLAISGAIRTGSYTDKEGNKRYTTDVIIESFEFIGSGQATFTGNGQAAKVENDGFEEVYEDWADGSPF